MPSTTRPMQNQLLANVPASEWEHWRAQLEPVDMPQGQVLCECGHKVAHVYFPTTSIVSLVSVMENGAAPENAVVGCEGMVGISSFLGGQSSTSRAVVRSAGKGLRIKVDMVQRELDQPGVMLHQWLRYTQALMTQTAQTAVCNRFHCIEQQLCRLLLLSLDRSPTNELRMTQELIANSLGVRREGVTEAAGHLQDAGLIYYRRGRIVVIDRAGLERRACECYRVIKKEYDRLLGPEAEYSRAA